MGIVVAVIVVVLVVYLGIAVFERLAPRPWVRAYQRAINPLWRLSAGLLPGFALIETTGRRTGLRRVTPVGGRLRRGVFWCVAGDGRHSAYVLNLEANPDVRVRVHGRWRTGVAEVLDDDDARRRLLHLNPFNSAFVAIAAREPLTVRIALEP